MEERRLTSALGVQNKGDNQAMTQISLGDLQQSRLLDDTRIDPRLRRK